MVDICLGVMLRLSFSAFLFIEDSLGWDWDFLKWWIGFLLHLYSLALEKVRMNQNSVRGCVVAMLVV